MGTMVWILAMVGHRFQHRLLAFNLTQAKVLGHSQDSVVIPSKSISQNIFLVPIWRPLKMSGIADGMRPL